MYRRSYLLWSPVIVQYCQAKRWTHGQPTHPPLAGPSPCWEGCPILVGRSARSRPRPLPRTLMLPTPPCWEGPKRTTGYNMYWLDDGWMLVGLLVVYWLDDGWMLVGLLVVYCCILVTSEPKRYQRRLAGCGAEREPR